MKTGIMKIDGAKLWELLTKEGLLDVPVRQMNREQLQALVECLNQTVGGTTPSFWIEYSDGTRCLVTPMTAPLGEKTWLQKNGRRALYDMLTRLAATEKEFHQYGLAGEDLDRFPLD